MSEEAVKENQPESAKAGSSEAGSPAEGAGELPSAASGAAAEAAAEEAVTKAAKNDEKPEIDLDKYVEKSTYEELERKLGEQGRELGDVRGFLKEITPLLDKLESHPDLVAAIMEDKIDTDLAKAIVDGKVSVEDATKVAEAHSEVKKDMGEKEYASASPEEISKLVEEKFKEMEKKLESGMTELESRRKFENQVTGFIESTEDFEEYAEDVVKWLENHPDQHDIETAYLAVKGLRSSADAEAKAAEKAKEVAGNAAGGQSQGGKLPENADPLDSLISRKSNPNIF